MIDRKFPKSRLRRLRRSSNLINLVSENTLSANDLIQPLFIKEDLDGSEPIDSMPNINRYGLKDILKEVGLKSSAKWILAEGADSSAMTRSIPIEKAMDDCIIAFKMNGESLRPEQGYPVRLVVPGWEGNMWVKWIRRIEVGDKPWHHREETSKYTDLFSNGKARRFTWEMDAKSVITNPSPQAPITHGRGQTVITGVAWSGRGKIQKVDVSIDGGVNWAEARLSGPADTKSMHRFYFEFNWDGKPLLLQSRAMDDTGYVQPTKDQLRSIRGENSIYHNNGIQTWAVDKDGIAENVEVS